MGSLVLRPASSRFLLCEKVFSIHSVLKVASQNRIFASGVYRQFPAPDFNRLVAMLPRHTVRSIITAQATIRYLVMWVALSRFIRWRTIRPTVVK
jgi:hypothetical protein